MTHHDQAEDGAGENRHDTGLADGVRIAEAGVQSPYPSGGQPLDSRFRGNDERDKSTIICSP